MTTANRIETEPTRSHLAPLIRTSKIQSRHLERLAVVYIRQSTLHQVSHNTESQCLQYGLEQRVQQLGWPPERIEMIDEDLATSATTVEGRPGFQRLVAEVGLDHVGILVGIELSRLARSCKDWYQLLEICALFGTLIADLDGIYDPMDYNDRLLLGLKGTMNEAELHVLKQRMHQAKLNKARRGALIEGVPIGYLRRPSGEVGLDPDEQVQGVVRLIFQKFSQYRTLNGVLQFLAAHNIQIGVRLRTGPDKGDLVWRRPNRHTLSNLLHHPIYAGAYTFGRRQVDPRRKQAGRPATGRVVLPPEKWSVLIQDFFPSYISWEQYLANQEQLEANHNQAAQRGAVRQGPSILAGLIVCGRCQGRMAVRYSGSEKRLSYICDGQYTNYGGQRCQSLSGKALNRLVSQQVLEVLEPASLELSLRAAETLEQERKQLAQLFEQRLERARYEAERAARQYRLVEPENRLVARQLERDWEQKLLAEQKLQQESDRFRAQQPRTLTEKQRAEIRQLASSIPALWQAPSTTEAERKTIVRQLVEKVVVQVIGTSEQVQVQIHWAGGYRTEDSLSRPVARWEQLSQYAKLKARLQQLIQRGLSSGQIAQQLNTEGWKPPKRADQFRAPMVRALLNRLGLGTVHRAPAYCKPKLKKNEWWLPELAERLEMPSVTLQHWIYRGWVQARQVDGKQGRWAVWTDAKELKRLEQLRGFPPGYWSRKHWFKTIAEKESYEKT
jgi:DNA invertase Pin-like site-specific DNA recombinase